jgi:hypothetical protein
MAGAGKRPPCDVHLVGGRGLVQEDPQAQKLRPDRRALDPLHLCGQNLAQAAFESLTGQHRSSPWPKADGSRCWSLEQVARSVEEVPRGGVAHGSCTSPRASRSLSSTKPRSASRGIGL